MKKRPRVCIIIGPTASGKSALAVEIAKKFNGEIISADSRQVYKGLDIGTGKISKREMKGVPHYLLDVISAKKTFTAYDFVQHARRKIIMICHNNHLPIICGGTGFYIDALLGRIQISEVPADKSMRALLEKKSAGKLYAKLKKLDSTRAKKIDKHNKRRLIRALEIARAAPRRSDLLGKDQYDVLWIGLAPKREELRERIKSRLKQRLRMGLRAEARRLHAKGLTYKRMYELGLEYRSLARFLQGKLTHHQLETELQHAISQYARRQMTYWRRNKDIQWFQPTETNKIEGTITRWLKI